MTDYIRRDALIEDIDEAVKHRGMGEIIGQTMRRYILRQPAADVAEVVYCKDCRYLGRELDKGLYSCGDYNLPYCEPDSYCSHGRRKEETKHAIN